ncbi:MAG: hypothetical protein JO214_14315 [Frankiaceae bacterium]|nr:hypothetical protein [Frankiaceae bacterium]
MRVPEYGDRPSLRPPDPITPYQLFRTVIDRPYRWWALLGFALFVAGGTTLPGFLPLLPGLVLMTVVGSLAASRLREQRQAARKAEH